MTFEVSIAKNSQTQSLSFLLIVLPCSGCRQAPCQSGALCTGVLGYIASPQSLAHVGSCCSSRARPKNAEFSTVHPVYGITLLRAPSADPSAESFESCESFLSWVVGPCSHGIALQLLPGRLCLLSNGNITPWESCHLFCCYMTSWDYPLTAAVPSVSWPPSGCVFISKQFFLHWERSLCRSPDTSFMFCVGFKTWK